MVPITKPGYFFQAFGYEVTCAAPAIWRSSRKGFGGQCQSRIRFAGYRINDAVCFKSSLFPMPKDAAANENNEPLSSTGAGGDNLRAYGMEG